MDKQIVTFTALPNGVASNGRLRLSVFVSPFLQPDGGGPVSLDRFPDWLDWPSRALTFQAQFGTADPIAATRVGPAPRSDLWTSLFGPDAQVGHAVLATAAAGFGIQATSDGEPSMFRSYDTRFIHQWLKGAYVDAAVNSPEEFPSHTALREVGPMADLASSLQDDWESAHDEGEGDGTGGGGGLHLSGLLATATKEDVRRAFDDLRAFHRPFAKSLAPRPSAAELRFDVHEVLTALSRYPVLMRLLGLVHDLELAPQGNLGDTTVQVLASWAPTSNAVETVVVPRLGGSPQRLETRCVVGATTFRALPRATNPELASDGSGQLPLDDADRYEVIQIDHDGAAIRSYNFAEQLVRHRKTSTDDTPDGYPLPALTSIGFAIARVGRGSVTTAAFVDGAAKNLAVLEGDDVTLDAEDVTRGYAIDAWDDVSGKWRSLCERVGTYAFTNPKKPITLSGIADEGWVSGAFAKPADEGSADDKAPRLPETMFQWYGWSLVASRPGKYLDLDGNLRSLDNEPGPQWPFAANFQAAPGSLPRLRFGTKYRLRARAVDLAGNRVSRSEAGAEHATPEAAYGRFDPISSPEVVPQAPLTEGESAQRLVIRSNFNSPMVEACGRHTFPPKAAEPMVEAHGVFDKSTGVIDTSGYGTIQALDGGTIDKIGKPDPNAPGGFYVGGSSTTTPYLPDLLSRGAVIRGLPGTSGPVQVSFGYTEGVKWPNPKPFLMQLVEGSGSPTWDKGKRLLTVKLPKADVVTARISSYLLNAEGDVDRLGLLRWLEEANVDADTLDEFRKLAADGRHWMVTPWRDLTFVHAVRQPLLRPKYGSLTPARELGQTFVTLSDAALEVSRKSTVTLDIVARWTELLDPLSEPGPLTATGNARPFQVQVPLAGDPADETRLAISGRHEFGDTKYRRIGYSAIATSRFGEHFAQRLRGVTLTGGAILVSAPVTDDGDNLGGVVAGSETVTASDRTRTFQRDVDYVMDYLAGTLAPTPQSPLVGQTVDIGFIAPPITRKAAAPVALDVPNAARPDAPKVLYAIPTFGWSASVNQSATKFESRRRGMGLRVYLDRPWYSSGDGERLGVVIWSGSGAPSDAQKAFVSEWALDPLYLSAATAAGPTVEAFTLADATRTSGLSLAELPDLPDPTPLHVAGHRVDYDAERKLWYADLEIGAGSSYYPFVRLALARYQPISVDDAHLSRVVRADFVQLAPDRAVTVTRAKSNSRVVNVTVAGPGYTKTKTGGRSVIEVSVEQKRANTDLSIAQELAWDELAGSAVALSPSGPAGSTVWMGTVTLPPGSAGNCRLLVKEFEVFDDARRPVYADAIVI